MKQRSSQDLVVTKSLEGKESCGFARRIPQLLSFIYAVGYWLGGLGGEAVWFDGFVAGVVVDGGFFFLGAFLAGVGVSSTMIFCGAGGGLAA